MDARHKRTFLTGIWVLSLLSPLALADTAEDMAKDMDRAKVFVDNMQMMDATVIYRRLAEQNHPPAQALMGEILDYTEADEEAVGWYIMAAFQGDAAGAYGLGKMYLRGEGINKDIGQALYWFIFAAEKDNYNAVTMMESAYRTGFAGSGLKVQIDPKQAEFWKAKKTLLDDARRKEREEKVAAIKKARKEKAAATKKADEDAAEKPK